MGKSPRYRTHPCLPNLDCKHVGASDYHPQIACAVTDGHLVTTNTFRNTRRGGSVVRLFYICLAYSICIRRLLPAVLRTSGLPDGVQSKDEGISHARPPQIQSESLTPRQSFTVSPVIRRKSRVSLVWRKARPKARAHGRQRWASTAPSGTGATALRVRRGSRPRRRAASVEWTSCEASGCTIACRTTAWMGYALSETRPTRLKTWIERRRDATRVTIHE